MFNTCCATIKYAVEEILEKGIHQMETELIEDEEKNENIILKNVEDSKKPIYHHETLLHCILRASDEDVITEFYLTADSEKLDAVYVVEKLPHSNFFVLKKHLEELEMRTTRHYTP